MVFGVFNMNNKAESAPAQTFSLTLEVVQVGVGGIEGEMTAFGGSSGIVLDGGSGIVATGIAAGASSAVSGNGYINCGDPGFFQLIGGTLSALTINGSSFTCTISNVTGNMTFLLPVQGTSTGGRSVTLEVIQTGPDGIEASAEAFGGADGAPVGQTVVIATGVQDGQSSAVTGTGDLLLGDPSLFAIKGATLSNLMILSPNEYQADIENVFDDVVFTVPVGGRRSEPAPPGGGGEGGGRDDGEGGEGGGFDPGRSGMTEEQYAQLQKLGFPQEEIQMMIDKGLPFEQIQMIIDDAMGGGR